jgi:RNA polymerase sigma-70 factor (ECF subfamily)
LSGALDRTARADGARIRAALAARFRDLDLAEEAFAEACARAAGIWLGRGVPTDPAAWLWRVAERVALDTLRRRRSHARLAPEPPEPEPHAEEVMASDAAIIPDERLRLIFVCCHPAVAAESRAALTLRLVFGLGLAEIARAFLLPEPTLRQRLSRAKRKIAEAGVPFEVPSPEHWPERLDAVLSTLEIAYAKAHEDAAGAGPHAGFAPEMLTLSATLAELVPREPEVLALAAMIRFAEARRPARLDAGGMMVPLTEQDPHLWRHRLIAEGDALLHRAAGLGPAGPRTLMAAIHGTWCARRSLAEPPPWVEVLRLYDALLRLRDDPITRLNRCVALAEVAGPSVALAALDTLDPARLAGFPPYLAVRADLLRRVGRGEEARAALDVLLALDLPPAERRWWEGRLEHGPPASFSPPIRSDP